MMFGKRLRKELVILQREPVPLVVAFPLEKDILEWRFLIKGIGIYAGGYYHGKLVFPPEYPLKPPSILFLTPSGRFEINRRICMSISDYHPESWAPSWTVGTILTGIVSFFNCDDPTVGSVTSTEADKRQYALASTAYNAKDKTFVKLFGSDMEAHFPGVLGYDATARVAPSSSAAAAVAPVPVPVPVPAPAPAPLLVQPIADLTIASLTPGATSTPAPSPAPAPTAAVAGVAGVAIDERLSAMSLTLAPGEATPQIAVKTKT